MNKTPYTPDPYIPDDALSLEELFNLSRDCVVNIEVKQFGLDLEAKIILHVPHDNSINENTYRNLLTLGYPILNHNGHPGHVRSITLFSDSLSRHEIEIVIYIGNSYKDDVHSFTEKVKRFFGIRGRER